ncbi:MAG TPA: hypothetical protein VJY62_02100 [Bacteroidia bacterium]|nr:hypothetical protein [Bacteroidia bacterium]
MVIFSPSPFGDPETSETKIQFLIQFTTYPKDSYGKASYRENACRFFFVICQAAIATFQTAITVCWTAIAPSFPAIATKKEQTAVFFITTAF